MIFERCHRKLVAIMYHRFSKETDNLPVIDIYEIISPINIELNVELNDEINSMLGINHTRNENQKNS
jgi:hypothetical protein